MTSKHPKTRFITLVQILRTGDEEGGLKEVPTITNIEGITHAFPTKLEVSGPVLVGRGIAAKDMTRVFFTTGQSIGVRESVEEIDLLVQIAQASDNEVADLLHEQLTTLRARQNDGTIAA